MDLRADKPPLRARISAASGNERGRLQICERTSRSLQAGGKKGLSQLHKPAPGLDCRFLICLLDR